MRWMKLTRLMRRMARRDFFKKNKEQNNPDNPDHGVDSRRHEEVALGVFPLPLSLPVCPAHSPRPDAPAVVLHQRHVLRVIPEPDAPGALVLSTRLIPRPEPRDGAHHAGAGAAAANERARSRVRGCCGVRAGAGEATRSGARPAYRRQRGVKDLAVDFVAVQLAPAVLAPGAGNRLVRYVRRVGARALLPARHVIEPRRRVRPTNRPRISSNSAGGPSSTPSTATAIAAAAAARGRLLPRERLVGSFPERAPDGAKVRPPRRRIPGGGGGGGSGGGGERRSRAENERRRHRRAGFLVVVVSGSGGGGGGTKAGGGGAIYGGGGGTVRRPGVPPLSAGGGVGGGCHGRRRRRRGGGGDGRGVERHDLSKPHPPRVSLFARPAPLGRHLPARDHDSSVERQQQHGVRPHHQDVAARYVR
jgi:hypothetical protein